MGLEGEKTNIYYTRAKQGSMRAIFNPPPGYPPATHRTHRTHVFIPFYVHHCKYKTKHIYDEQISWEIIWEIIWEIFLKTTWQKLVDTNYIY